jgi:hypothetical protein
MDLEPRLGEIVNGEIKNVEGNKQIVAKSKRRLRIFRHRLVELK